MAVKTDFYCQRSKLKTPLKANWKILELSTFGRKKSNRTKQGPSYRFAQITRKAVEVWLKKTSQRPRKILYPKCCHPRINLSVCYISRWCFPVAFKIFNMQFYPWDVTPWRWCLLTQQIISAWIFSLISPYVEISSAFHHCCATGSRWFWGSYLCPWVHLSLENNPVLQHLRNCSGTQSLFTQRLTPATQHSRAKRHCQHCQVQVLGAAVQPHGLQTLTPLTPVQPLGKSQRGTGRNESSICTAKTFHAWTKQQLLSEGQFFCKTQGPTESFLIKFKDSSGNIHVKTYTGKNVGLTDVSFATLLCNGTVQSKSTSPQCVFSERKGKNKQI